MTDLSYGVLDDVSVILIPQADAELNVSLSRLVLFTGRDFSEIEDVLRDRLVNRNENGNLMTMLGLYTGDVIPPRFTITFQVLYKSERTAVISFFQNQEVFVLMFGLNDCLSEFAVVMLIEESVHIRVDNGPVGALKLKARAIQRCQVLSFSRACSIPHLQKVKIRLLPEPEICFFPNSVCSTQLQRHSCGKLSNCLMRNCKYRRNELIRYPLPGWFYNFNETNYCVENIVKLLPSFQRCDAPTDALVFSYWFIRYFPFTPLEQAKIMQLDSCFQRLKYALEFLKWELVITCERCKTEIAQVKGAFFRAINHVFSGCFNGTDDAIAIIRLKNFYYNPELMDYNRPLSCGIACSKCSLHLGYLIVSSNEDTMPTSFFELYKACFTIQNCKDTT